MHDIKSACDSLPIILTLEHASSVTTRLRFKRVKNSASYYNPVYRPVYEQPHIQWTRTLNLQFNLKEFELTDPTLCLHHSLSSSLFSINSATRTLLPFVEWQNGRKRRALSWNTRIQDPFTIFYTKMMTVILDGLSVTKKKLSGTHVLVSFHEDTQNKQQKGQIMLAFKQYAVQIEDSNSNNQMINSLMVFINTGLHHT